MDEIPLRPRRSDNRLCGMRGGGPDLPLQADSHDPAFSHRRPHRSAGRQVGIKLTEQMGQPVVPENRPGVGGNLGAEIAAKSPADGYTIALSANVLAISPSFYRKLNYDPINDLAPLSLAAQLRGD